MKIKTWLRFQIIILNKTHFNHFDVFLVVLALLAAEVEGVWRGSETLLRRYVEREVGRAAGGASPGGGRHTEAEE